LTKNKEYASVYAMAINKDQLNSSLRKQYKLRMAIPGTKTVEVTFPYEVVEREARKHNLTVQEFLAQYIAVAQYDNFDGVFYSFEPSDKNGGNPP
jgi:hypothetical protein